MWMVVEESYKNAKYKSRVSFAISEGCALNLPSSVGRGLQYRGIDLRTTFGSQPKDSSNKRKQDSTDIRTNIRKQIRKLGKHKKN